MLGLTLLLAGCASQGAATLHTPAAAPAATTLTAWAPGGGKDLIEAISRDMGAASAATDIARMNAACVALQTDVEAAQAYGSLPDTVAQTYWSAALKHVARAATACVAHNFDVGLLNQATSELGAATTALRRCTDWINVLRR